ncbi:unnamed protein product, partial [Cylicostephanus goldi]
MDADEMKREVKGLRTTDLQFGCVEVVIVAIYDHEVFNLIVLMAKNNCYRGIDEDASHDDVVIPSTSAESPNVQQTSNKDKSSKKKPTYRILSQLPLDEWDIPDSCLQKTAEVVGILEKKNSRLATGKLELASAAQRQWAKFSPSDSRIPRMMIEASQLPHDFFDRPQDFAKFLFVAKIADWPENSMMACGNLEKQLGLAGDID